MGQFSWIASDDKRPVLDDVYADVYLLIPAKFGGGAYHTDYYDGYGRIEVDVYDAVADWNKDYLQKIYKKEGSPKLSDFSDKLSLWDKEGFERDLGRQATEEELVQHGKVIQKQHYERAKKEFKRMLKRAEDFQTLTDAEMKEKYGDDYKRLIGIDIACYDKDNASLPYSIKIVHEANMSYEQALPSMGDPNQGWGFDYDYESELDEEEQAEEYLQKVANDFDRFINNYYTKYKTVGDELRKGKE